MTQTKRRTIARAVTIEAWCFLVVLIAAFWLYKSGMIAEFIVWVSSLGPILGGFAAGAAFSTFVTTPFAIAGFVEMGAMNALPVWQIAIAGAIGATVMDFLLVKGVRSPLASLIVQAVVGRDPEAFKSRIRKNTVLRWCSGIFGGFLMAIPLPTDELGVVFFGASGLKPLQMIPVIFVADFIGVYAIVSATRVISGV